ncbi:PEP-CTERM sorting domain-containing protein [Massilia norwichensis]|uniref:PEP-CTERM sorting domain-containing protein n=1 Tax=Massilia norwichensis TaxID=1442366 RepID=A0ABT2A731_9BURK|nr:PEP-CTERM sorting domain-containing protein [Massilia norwichensis]MCS0590018.1 PEP-CTERM sorting domain-containing protein [Massilia norwichensis]
MKKLLLSLAAATASAGAIASPAITLPTGGLYLKYTGQEQIAINGATTFAGTKEINWGVFVVSTLETGDVNTPGDSIDPSGDGPFFVNKQAGGQITGMFYGIEKGGDSVANAFPATKGYMDLYWRDLDKYSATSLSSTAAGIRCGYDCAVGYTEGTFLARLYFDTGMDVGNSLNTIVGSQVPSSKGFSGQADSYASVDMTKQGLWSFHLNSNWFNTAEGQRDLRFKNSYNYNSKWSAGPNILGARVDDPGQAFAVPEPGALSLMGLALVGMGAVLRRRRG